MNQRGENVTVYEKYSTATEFLFDCGLQDTTDIWKGWAVHDTSEQVYENN